MHRIGFHERRIRSFRRRADGVSFPRRANSWLRSTKRIAKRLLCLVVLGFVAEQAVAQDHTRPTVWILNRLDTLGGRPVTAVGAPKLLDMSVPGGVEFDGQDDGIFVDANPLRGLTQFTVEVSFRPAADGPQAQRFLHFQESGSENRLLFETRLTSDGKWFLDTFLKSNDGNYTLYAERTQHPIGPWYHAAVVVDGKTMRHFVDGQEELAMPIMFAPLESGRTSLGVRINNVSWFKGAIRQVRITARALGPSEFTRPDP